MTAALRFMLVPVVLALLLPLPILAHDPMLAQLHAAVLVLVVTLRIARLREWQRRGVMR